MNKNDLIVFNNFTDEMIEKLLTGEYKGICSASSKTSLPYEELTFIGTYVLMNYLKHLREFLSVPDHGVFWWPMIYRYIDSGSGYNIDVRVYALELFRNYINDGSFK